MQSTKMIQVLLTRYEDPFSRLVYNLTGHGFTHASLGLGQEPTCFYSFNRRGFCEETLEKHRRHGMTLSRSYQLEVSEAAYAVLEQHLQGFRQQRDRFHYAKVGVMFCLLHIPFREKNGYFCSQFVSELLETAGVLQLKKKSVLYVPNQFQQDLAALPCLHAVQSCVA